MISNGFDTAKVLSAMTGRLGWKQPNSASPIIDADNLTALSGRHFEDFHSIVRIKYLYDTVIDIAQNDADFNEHLKDLQQSVILEVLNAVFRKPQLVESKRFFERCGGDISEIENDGNFVGFKIQVANGQYAIKIDKVSLYFDDAVTFDLHLFNEGASGSLWSKSVTANANAETIIPIDDCIFKFSSDETISGDFYLGYFQDDLGSTKAVEQDFIRNSDHLVFCQETFAGKALSGVFDKQENERDYDNYGLNVELSTFRDYTKLIVQNSFIFDELIGLSMAIKVIEGIIYSDRSNKTQRIESANVEKLAQDLNLGQTMEGNPFVPGLKSKYERELKKVYHNFFPIKTIKTGTPTW